MPMPMAEPMPDSDDEGGQAHKILCHSGDGDQCQEPEQAEGEVSGARHRGGMGFVDA